MALLEVLLTVVAVEFFIIYAGRMISMQNAGTIEHLKRILKDMANAIERLGVKWKEKSLAIVDGPYTDYKADDSVVITILRGDDGNGEWWKAQRHWSGGWMCVTALRPVSGTDSQRQIPFSAPRSPCYVNPKFWSRDVSTLSRLHAWQQHYMVQANGPIHNQCFRRCASGS